MPPLRHARATSAFLKQVRDLLARRGQRFAYVRVLENDAGDGSKGGHAHILLHLPPAVSLGSYQPHWQHMGTRRNPRQPMPGNLAAVEEGLSIMSREHKTNKCLTCARRPAS